MREELNINARRKSREEIFPVTLGCHYCSHAVHKSGGTFNDNVRAAAAEIKAHEEAAHGKKPESKS